MCCVPLPWWTSQSKIRMRGAALLALRRARRDRDVVEQAEAHRADPPRRDGPAAARRRSCAGPRRAARRARARWLAPAASRATSKLVGDVIGVGIELAVASVPCRGEPLQHALVVDAQQLVEFRGAGCAALDGLGRARRRRDPRERGRRRRGARGVRDGRAGRGDPGSGDRRRIGRARRERRSRLGRREPDRRISRRKRRHQVRGRDWASVASRRSSEVATRSRLRLSRSISAREGQSRPPNARATASRISPPRSGAEASA